MISGTILDPGVNPYTEMVVFRIRFVWYNSFLCGRKNDEDIDVMAFW